MPDDKLKVKLDKYTQPENVKGLRTPKVNPLIRTQLSATMKPIDLSSELNSSVIPMSMRKAADLVFQKYHQDRDLIILFTGAIAMPFHFSHEVNRSRRQAALKV